MQSFGEGPLSTLMVLKHYYVLFVLHPLVRALRDLLILRPGTTRCSACVSPSSGIEPSAIILISVILRFAIIGS
jgi:hypothetical protein